MALEIERKFLVANDGWKHSIIRSMRIRDGLIANNKGTKLECALQAIWQRLHSKVGGAV